MNMNKKVVRLTIAATAISLTAAGCLINVKASKADELNEKDESKAVEASAKTTQSAADQADTNVVNTIEEVAGTDNSDVDKSETVYVKTDPNGKQKSIIVSDWLKNKQKESTITDFTDLTDIENVKGYETYTKNNDGTITWASTGDDIYYQGKSTKDLPVGMKVTYYLNDKEVLPGALAGKSGKVKMRFDYINHSVNQVTIGDEEATIYTPFTMITGMILPSDKFSNVEVSSGKIISDGNDEIVVGYATPGLEESLDLKDKDVDIDMPDYFEVTADVKDFELSMTATIATADVLSDFDIDEIEDFDDLEDSMDDLTDASKELVDATVDLADGVNTLKDGTSSLRDGVETLNDKSAELLDGMATLGSGASQLNEGVGDLADGTGTLKDGAEKLDENMQTLVDGLQSTKDGADTLVANYSAAIDGANQIAAGLTSLNEGAATLQSGVSSMGDSLAGAVADYTAKIQEAADGISNAEAEKSDLISKQSDLITGIEQTIQAGGDPSELENQLAQVQAGIAQYDEGLANAYNLKGQAEGAVAALTQIQDQLASSGLSDGVAAISSGSSDLATGANNLSAGINQLKDGTTSLQGALGSLSDGGQNLKDGTSSLSDGAADVDSGAKKIYKATGKLVDGTSTLYDGGVSYTDGVAEIKDGGIELDDGVTDLKDGTSDLKDGMAEFDDEGIQELSDSFNGDIKPLKDRLNAVKEAGDNYKIFSESRDGSTTSVKFIFTSEAI